MAGRVLTVGQCIADPIVAASGRAVVPVDIDWIVQTRRDPVRTSYVLTEDPAKSVDLGEFVTGVHVLHWEADQPVTMTFATSVAAGQLLPTTRGHIEFPSASPMTALSLTRPVGVETTVHLLLAEEPA